MTMFEKIYTPLILTAALLGIAFSQVSSVKHIAGQAILPLLMVMLTLTFFQVPLREVKQAFTRTTFTQATLVINFLWSPLLAWGLASVFLSDHPSLYIGFIMLMITPCTDWYLVFTGIAKGDVALSTAILPVNLLLQLLLLPVFLLLFAGTGGIVQPAFLIESVLMVLFLPFLIAILFRFLLKNTPRMMKNLQSGAGPLPVVFLCLAIAAMFASEGRVLLENLSVLWIIFVPITLFFFINFFIGRWAGNFMNFPESWRTSLTMTTLARNSPVALAVAMTAFPDRPLVALALITGPLLELPVLAAVSQILLYISRHNR
ncbi:arsenic resistance protein [Salimicrobium jeotgali]|uniref:Arsenic resistance protein n=1 Tax=Salimicrobium jeotgali TaxID=1230341 RepID=K2H7B9_9BACI|nr:bile acid:sodium symporter [Salimicrobium jeotgali]AKG04900.1 arsenic resistance protein [Salimicrobium jeotgali]EKE31570.1 sodium symporter [Salimicrobium jeotgali]MBM7696390.1 ACR3 family arsenite efflux pump ArsB [Salimicrobium jeotgali]